MSTKMTLAYKNAEDDSGFHLYEECFQVDGVYLQLNDWDFLSVDGRQITVRIPLAVFEMIGKKELVRKVVDRAQQIKQDTEAEQWAFNTKEEKI
jgi:hypothetical protein